MFSLIHQAVEEETERTKKMEWFKEIVTHLMANRRYKKKEFKIWFVLPDC